MWFIKNFEIGFAIIAVYVDSMNLIKTPEKLSKTTKKLKKEFEVKDLGKTKLYLGLKFEQKANEIFIHQSAYKAHSLSTPMVARSFEPKKKLFRPKEPDKKLLALEVPYLNSIRGFDVLGIMHKIGYRFCDKFFSTI